MNFVVYTIFALNLAFGTLTFNIDTASAAVKSRDAAKLPNRKTTGSEAGSDSAKAAAAAGQAPMLGDQNVSAELEAGATGKESSAGATGKNESLNTNTAVKEKKKSTQVSFDDVLVQGKYHFSDEAVTTVEQDKVLDALLGVRTDFKDRIKKSSARY
jgi:hypothetical protein